MEPPGRPLLSTATMIALWAVVILEMVTPLPMLLSLGAAYVLLARPRWFLDLVRRLYGEAESGARD